MTRQRKVDDIKCLDKYEKEKLVSIFSIHKDESIFVIDAENLIDNEIIVRLKDKSSHSVTLLNKDNAKYLFFLIKEINQGNRKFVKAEDSNSNENTVKIISETTIL